MIKRCLIYLKTYQITNTDIIIKTVKVKDIKIGRSHPLVLIAGPCQIQDLDHTLIS